MESMVEENGNSSLDPLGDAPASLGNPLSPQQTTSGNTTILTTSSANLVHFIPAQNIQVNNKTYT